MKADSRNTKRMLLCFLVASVCVKAQESKVIQGSVTSPDMDVVGVVVQNITSKLAVVTDAQGNFSIPVQENDTLVFSAVQYKKKVLPITKEIYTASYIMVRLEDFVNELSEVVIKPYNLSGNLGQDLDVLTLEKDVTAEALGLPNADVRIISQSENKLNDADHGKFLYFYGVGFAINVNKILNRISGRTKMLKERVLLDEEYEKVKNAEEKFMDSIFINQLKIPKDSFYDFVYYCQIDNKFQDLIDGNDELKLWDFMIQKSRIYRKNNNLD